MTDLLTLDTSNYLNIQGVASLKNRINGHSDDVKHEVSQQFESILVQMLLKSMRDAGKIFSSNDESAVGQDVYQDLFDKQVSLSIAHQGLGFSDALEHYLQTLAPPTKTSEQISHRPISPLNSSQEPSQFLNLKKPLEFFSNELEFVQSLWKEAKLASTQLGVDPKLLLAQAALETGWGRHIISDKKDGYSYNLFNIKAGSQWKKNTVTRNTLEEKEGLIKKETASYRSYSSFEESFKDYVDFIKSNPRYDQALHAAKNPETYIQKLQEAHYATDSNYSEKVLEIYHGTLFNTLFEEAKLI